MAVTLKTEGNIATVTIDNPPVNATSRAVRLGLWDVITETEADTNISAVVLLCAGRSFIAGADVREFGQPPQEPTLPDLLMRLERTSKPWVAALHGHALGGGLETALACSHRVAVETAKLGLPEVTLGLIPGAGGTVRLPRLIPADQALTMIAQGKPIPAKQAQAMGLVDLVVADGLKDAALNLAQNAAAAPKPAPLSQRPLVPFERAEFEALAAKVTQKTSGQNAPTAAVSVVRKAVDLPFNAALAAERESFTNLKSDPQSSALRHVFFAERNTTKHPRLSDATPRDIARIGVIGGGTMGSGIAAALLLAGFEVVMVERTPEAAKAGARRVEQILHGSLKRGLINEERFAALIARFAASDSYATLSAIDMVIEAAFEDMAVKREVFAALVQNCPSDAILATNTSYLDVNQIADAIAHPERVIGLHFFSPAHIMKLLEIVVPKATSDAVLATTVKFAKTLRKIPVLSGVCDGFIANRIMSAYRREAEYMLEDGALPWQIDAAMRAYGFPMGLFEMQDLAGLDISWAMRKRQAGTRDPAQRYVDIGDKLCESGHFGRKSGQGYYVYDAAGHPSPSKDAEALILAESARKGIPRQDIPEDGIMTRILGAMQSEGDKILEEGIACSADDIDVVMVNAYGFPRWKGGPMWQKRQQGIALVEQV